MKNKERGIKKGFFSATTILLALIVVVLISSCSSDMPQLCNVSVQLEGSGSRELSAVIDPLSGYTIYYKSIYRGSGTSYGNMAESPYKKLDEKGILVSQGLWEIQVVFTTDTKWNGTSIGTTEITASSGDIFINLNTKSIRVHLLTNNGVGFINVSSYELVAPPSNDSSISVTCYKYDETKSSFNTSGTTINIKNSGNTFSSTSPKNRLSTGIYYAVVEVKGTVSGKEIVLFTDFVGFVVRDSLTTNISGSCSTYNYSSSSNGNFIVTEKDQSDKAEIKNFIGSEFNNNGTYTITGGTYKLIPDDTSDTTRTNKVLGNNQDIKINMNGNAIVNSNENLKTSFTIGSGAKLTIFNDNKDNSTNPKTIGYNTKSNPKTYDTNPNFIVNGGTLTIGSTSPTVEGSIDLKGGPASLSSSETKHAAIVLSKNGGTVNLYSPGNGSYVNVEETTIGIATAFDDTYEKTGTAMDIFINMVNSSIYAQGDMNDYATGIRLDGTKSTSENYSGTINIDIKGTGKEGHSIQTSYDDTDITTTSVENSCIYIRNYAGDINLSFDEYASLYSKNGYAIALENCTGEIVINNKGNLSGSVKRDGITRSTTGIAIYLKNCSKSVTIINSGTLSKDDSNYQVYSANSKVTVRTTDKNGNVIETDDNIYQPPATSN